MTDPGAIDFATALQKALYDRLVATIPGGDKRVFQHVPEKTPPPVVIIGDMNSDPRGGKGDIADTWTVVIFAVTMGTSRSDNLALQTKVRAALGNWKPAATEEVIFGRIDWPATDTNPVLKDNIYYGTITLDCTTEPA